MPAFGTQRRFHAVREHGRFWGEADMKRQGEWAASVESDPGCVKTLRGITAPGILGYTVTRRAKNRKNLSSARHYEQIRFRFHTAKTQRGHCLCIAASRACANLLPVRFHRRVLGPIESPLVPLLDGMLPALRFGAMLEVQALRAVPRYAVEHGRDHLRRL